MTNACEGVIGNCQLEVSLLNCPWKSCHPQSKFQLNDREIREVPMKADLNLKMPIKRVRICEEILTINFLSPLVLMDNAVSYFHTDYLLT